MSSSTRLVSAALVLAAACGPSVTGNGDDVQSIDAATDGATDGRVIDGPGGIDADESPPSRVYAHSGQMLYRIDTTTNAAIPIGPFTNLGTQSMTDIAVDRDERMIGVTLNKIFEVDEATGACTLLASFTGTDNLTSLSFVPANPAAPDGPEMLVAATVVGTGTGFDKIFGVAFWGGQLYGFADGGAGMGSFVRLDRQTGAGTLLQAGTIRWFGAGVTTSAPIIP